MSHSPYYEHDCDACVFLGRVGQSDAYACPQSGMPTVVMRYGDDGPEYESGRALLDDLPEAMRERAKTLMKGWR